MLELLVVRHAIAFERDPKRWPDDRLRPLTPQGKRRFERSAAGIARWFPKVDLLLSSPLTRAQQTAGILSDVLGWPKPATRDELDPETDPARTLSSLRQPRVQRLAFVGHEPHLSSLIALCVAESPSSLRIKLKKGAIALIRFEGTPAAGKGRLEALLPPRLLRRLA